jgi:hypothetical protein
MYFSHTDIFDSETETEMSSFFYATSIVDFKLVPNEIVGRTKVKNLQQYRQDDSVSSFFGTDPPV